MSKLTTFSTFTPAASVNLVLPSGGASVALALPAVDSGNTAMTVTNSGNGPVWLAFGASANVPAGPAVIGSRLVCPGEVALFTTAGQGTATYIGVQSAAGAFGGSLTVTRGTVATLQAFSTADDAPAVV